MSLLILVAVLGGAVLGLYVLPDDIIGSLDIIVEFGLCLLLFFVGIDITRGGGLLKKIRELGVISLGIPLAIIIGSVFGSILVGFLIGMPYNESGSVGAGLGWYSWSGIYLENQYSVELGTIAFTSNVFREIIALICIPFVAKYLGYRTAIAPAGATAMDTALAVVSGSTDSKTALLSFVTGVILSLAVPVLVPIIINL